MKQVILHVGFAKTASTSIQNTLAENRDILYENGIAFARFSLNNIEITNHSLALTYLFSKKSEKHHIHVKFGLNVYKEKLRAQRELEDALNLGNTVIISGEEVSFFEKDDLRRIKDFFSERGVPLRVIAFVRPTVSFLESLAQQLVKSGFPLELAYNNTPAKMMRRILSSFPDAEFYSFEEATRYQGGPVAYFLNKIGVKIDLRGVVAKDNPALSDNAAHLCAFINELAPTVRDGALNPLRRADDIAPFAGIKGPKFFLRASDIDMGRIAQEVEWISKNYGPSFIDSLDTLSEGDCEWSQEQIVQAARALDYVPLPLVPLVHGYFRHTAKLEQGARINPIRDTVRRLYFNR